MKKIILILSVFLLSCNQKDNTELLIEKNNVFLLDNLDIIKERAVLKSLENPKFSKLYPNDIENIVKLIININNHNKYLKSLNLIKDFNKKYRVKTKHNPINESNLNLLKNDALLYFTKCISLINFNKKSVEGTYCVSNPIFKNEYSLQKDSVIINTVSGFRGNYYFVTDSIISLKNKRKIIDYKSSEDKIINKISLSNDNKPFAFYGKVIFNFDGNDFEIIERLCDTIN